MSNSQTEGLHVADSARRVLLYDRGYDDADDVTIKCFSNTGHSQSSPPAGCTLVSDREIVILTFGVLDGSTTHEGPEIDNVSFADVGATPTQVLGAIELDQMEGFEIHGVNINSLTNSNAVGISLNGGVVGSSVGFTQWGSIYDLKTFAVFKSVQTLNAISDVAIIGGTINCFDLGTPTANPSVGIDIGPGTDTVYVSPTVGINQCKEGIRVRSQASGNLATSNNVLAARTENSPKTASYHQAGTIGYHLVNPTVANLGFSNVVNHGVVSGFETAVCIENNVYDTGISQVSLQDNSDTGGKPHNIPGLGSEAPFQSCTGGINSQSILVSNLIGGVGGGPLDSTFKRIHFSGGTAMTAARIALDGTGKWGNAATVTAVSGFDQSFTFTVTSLGAGQGSNPTITVTFADLSWGTIPGCFALRTGGTDAFTNFTNTTPGAASYVFTAANFTPTLNQTTIVTVTRLGR